ncbi:MAG: two-component regulator propeller domain-containing protein [Ferruginibacter sp.]
MINRIRNNGYGVVSAAFVLFSHGLFASGFPPITYLGIEKGLSNNSVRCIYQDHNGFMWFGTFDGLNRYDGYDFKIFRKQIKDPNSLPHNYINAIGEDHRNNIWIGTGQGVSIYNNLTSTFFPGFFIPFGRKQKERILFNISTIKTDSKGTMYIGTSGGGLLVQPDGSDAAIQLKCGKHANGKCRNDVQCIFIDQKQRVWLFIRDLGLCLYNESGKGIQVINTDLTTALCMEADDVGNLWIGTTGGLYKYNIQSRLLLEPAIKLSSRVINSLKLDRRYNLWIGTEGGGINVFNPSTGKVSYILSGKNQHGLSSEDVVAVYEDKESRKWIGTLKGGINIIDIQKNKFQTIAHDQLNSNSLVGNFVSGFYEDQQQNIWIGTDDGGISIWNRQQNNFTNYRHIAGDEQSLSHNAVPCFQEDYMGNVWIATFGGGINKFNKASRNFEHYTFVNGQTGEVQKYVWLIYEDRDKNLWAATYGNGRLYLLNRLKNRFEVFCPDPVDVHCLKEDHTGTLWAGTTYGFFKVDKQNKSYQYYQTSKPVRAILEDKKGRLWIGTEGIGLVLFDRAKSKITENYTDADGLCNNSVLNILEDRAGKLWLSTFHGLSRFDPFTKTFKNFYQEDGLQSNQFSYNAALGLQSGELAFGGINGFNIFNPDSLPTRNYNPPVLITGLRINNTQIAADSKYITSFNADKIESLKIPFSEAVLSLDFAALEFSASGKISYAYYLEGWDKGWNYSGNLRTANYTRLSEGHYKLHIKATNADGVWNPKEVQLRVVIIPPWYRSWWANTFYILMLVGVIIFYQRYRAGKAKLEYEIKLANANAEKERAQRETEKVINEREKEINEKRHTFFTDISHEFRTPLTLILNPLKDILARSGEDTNTDINELNIVYRNARRMLSLVDQLLLFRKTDTGADQLKIAKLNFTALCKEVFLAFEQQAKALKINYHFESNNEELEIFAEREKIEIILYNLISNSLKYTPKGGAVAITISESDSHVKVAVKDTGHGIPKEVGNKLFERFYQVKEKGVPSKPGFGIGLYLVNHFVQSHHGQISYQSEPGMGTSFLVQFRKGKEHFGDQPIFEETPGESILSHGLIEEQLAVEKLSWKDTELAPLITEMESILVVDDDEPMRMYLHQVFCGKYTVYLAVNGEEGLKLAHQFLPDIIISDVKMPGMSGIDFCKAVKEDNSLSHIPVILLTGEPSVEMKLEGIEGGADDYITKPFEKKLLLAKVVNFLKSRSNLQSYFYNEITLQENPLKISEEHKEFLEKCICVVEKHVADVSFNVKTLAAELNISHSNLYKKVKSISGQSVNAFIRFIRLRKAAELLINSKLNINEVAFEVGFTSSKYFREQFAKLFGMNPSDYIKKYRKTFGKSYNLNEGGNKDKE